MVDSFHSTRLASFTGTPKAQGSQRLQEWDNSARAGGFAGG